MKRILLILLVIPFLFTGCAGSSKEKNTKKPEDKKNVTIEENKKKLAKEVAEKIAKGKSTNWEELTNDADACVEYILDNPTSVGFKYMTSEARQKFIKVFKDEFVLREGILRGEWTAIENMAKDKNNAFKLNPQNVADLQAYFDDPSKMPGKFMKTGDAKKISFMVYFNAKLRGKINIYKKLEGKNALLNGYQESDGTTFEYYVKQSPEDLKKELLEDIKTLEALNPDEALITRMGFGITD